jgi:type II secretion system protein L
MSRQILAIDIRNNAVAVVLLNTGLKNSTIQHCAYTAVNGSSKSTESIFDTLETLFEGMRVENPTCVVSLPSAQLFFRNTSLPFNDDKKIRQILPFELEPVLPVPIDSLIIDYQKSVDEQKTDVIAIAVEQEKLKAYLADLNTAAIHPQLVVPCSFPLALALLEHEQQIPEQALLIDIDYQSADLYLFLGRQIAMVRSLPSGIETEAKAEAFALRVRQTLAALGDRSTGPFAPAVVYLSGPAMCQAENQKRLAAALELPLRAIDLCTYLPRIEAGDAVQDWTPCLTDNALAMALMEAENRPCPTFHRSSSPLLNYWRLYGSYVKKPAILMAVVLFLGLFSVWLEGHFLEKRVNKLKAQMVQIYKSTFPDTTPLENVPYVEQMRSKLKQARDGRVDPAQNIPKYRTIELLQAISANIPKELDIILSRMVVGDDGVTLSGDAGAFNAVDDIKSRLAKVPLFKQVTITSANMDKSGKIVKFKLKIEI